MVVVFLVVLYTGLLSAIAGLCFYRAAGAFFRFGTDAPPFVTVSLAGLSLLTTIAAFLSLGINIGLAAQGIVIALTLLYIACDRKYVAIVLSSWTDSLKRTPAVALVFVAGGTLCLLVYSVVTPDMYDTYFYHAPAIRWIEEYPAVPGLGNFHSRLAFNSASFVANALFGFSFLKAGPFHLINSYVFLLFLLWISSSLKRRSGGEIFEVDMFKGGVMVAVLFLGIRSIASPSPDMMTMFLCWLIFGLAFERMSEHGMELDAGMVSLLLCSSFLASVKLAALPMLILPFLFVARELLTGQPLQGTKLLSVLALPLLPFVARNVILSGYLVYPFPAIDLFGVDWKVPFHKVMVEKDIIHSHARAPLFDFQKVLAMPFLTWFPLWLKNSLSYFDKGVFSLTLLAAASYTSIICFARPALSGMLRNHGRYFALHATALAGVLFWFFTAPAPRFGYGFIIPLCILLLLPLVLSFPGKYLHFVYPKSAAAKAVAALFLVLALSGQLVDLSRTFFSNLEKRLLVHPAGYDRTEIVAAGNADFEYFIPIIEKRIGYAPLPTTPFGDIEVKLRGSTVRNGFRYAGKMHSYPPGKPPESY